MDDTSSAELGNLLSEYRGTVGYLIFGILIAIIFIGIGILFAIPGAMSVSDGDGSGVMLIMFGVFFGIVGVLPLIAGIFNRLHVVRVYERGLFDKKVTGEKTIRWDEVRQVSYKPRNTGMGALGFLAFGALGYAAAGGSGQPLVITLKDGKKVKFQQSMGKINELAKEVGNLAADALLPDARTTLESGGSLGYGGFAVSKQGITQGKRTITWMEIGRTMVNGRKIELYDAVSDKMLVAIDLTSNPNGALMKKLIEEYSEKHRV